MMVFILGSTSDENIENISKAIKVADELRISSVAIPIIFLQSKGNKDLCRKIYEKDLKHIKIVRLVCKNENEEKRISKFRI